MFFTVNIYEFQILFYTTSESYALNNNFSKDEIRIEN